MKKTICCLLTACLLLGVTIAAVPKALAAPDVSVSTAFQPPALQLDGADGLETLLFDLKLDEEDDSVQTEMLLRNPTGSDIAADLSLSTEAAAPDTVIFYTDGAQTGIPDRITVPAGGSLHLQYTYKTADALQDVKVIAFDYSQLVFTEGAKIGRFSASVHMLSEDVPLVTDIRPVNYTFADQTVSAVLDDFSPSCLLDRFVIAKDTWKDLASSREFEPNEAQLYFLEHYRGWFADGMPVGTENYIGHDYNVMIGKDPEDWETFYEGGFDDLYEHTDGFVHAACYLYQKACQKASGDTGIDPDMFGFDPREPLLLAESLCSEAQREALRTVVCVEFADNPTLEGHGIYAKKTVEQGWDEERGCYSVIEDVPVTQQQAVMTSIPTTQLSGGLPLASHTALLPGSLSATPEEIAAFVDAIGAAYYIRQMLYDSTVTPYPTVTSTVPVYDDDGNEIGEESYEISASAMIGYCGEENEPIAVAATEMSEMDYYEDYKTLPVSDPVLERLDIPAVLLYRGYVYTENGRDYVEFTTGHYLDPYNGIRRCESVAETARAQALLSAVQARRDETRSRLDAEIADARQTAETEPSAVPETEAEPEKHSAKEFPYVPLLIVSLAGAAVTAAILLLLRKKEGKDPS